MNALPILAMCMTPAAASLLDKPATTTSPTKPPLSLTAYISVLMDRRGQGAEEEKQTTGAIRNALSDQLQRRDKSLDSKALDVKLEQISLFSLTRPAPEDEAEDEDLLRFATIAACRGRSKCRVSRGIATSSDGSKPPFMGLGKTDEAVPPTLTEGGFMLPGKRRLSGAFTESDSGESVFVVVDTLEDSEALDAPPQLEVGFLASSRLTVIAPPIVVEARLTVAMAEGGAWRPADGSTAVSSAEELAERFGERVGSADVLRAALGYGLAEDAIVVISTATGGTATALTPHSAHSPATSREAPRLVAGHEEEAERARSGGADTAMIAGVAAAAAVCLVALLAGATMLLHSRCRVSRPALRRDRGSSGAGKDKITEAQVFDASACAYVV